MFCSAGQMTPGSPFTPAPPRAAERLLRWSLAPDERAAVLGDVQEEFAAIAETDHARAVRWYWRQTATSVGPNIARQVRNQWAEARHVIDEKDRRLRKRRLIGGLSWIGCWTLACGALAWAVPARAHDFLAYGLTVAIPGALFVLTYWYRPMPATSRRARHLFRIWLASSLLGGLHNEFGETVRQCLWMAMGLLYIWPQAMWPFRRALPVRAYSLRSPVVAYRGNTGLLAFGSVTVPPVPWSMSNVIVGRSVAPVDVKAAVDDVVPMVAVVLRVFTSRDSIRLFTVVNTVPEGLHGTLEIRRTTTNRVIATMPATVRPATPQAPFKQPRGTDPDSEPPLLPESPMSELDAVVSLSGLAVDNYMFSLIATNGEHTAEQDVDIRVWAGANW
jgi:hypothetical protein